MFQGDEGIKGAFFSLSFAVRKGRKFFAFLTDFFFHSLENKPPRNGMELVVWRSLFFFILRLTPPEEQKAGLTLSNHPDGMSHSIRTQNTKEKQEKVHRMEWTKVPLSFTHRTHISNSFPQIKGKA